MSTEIKNRLTQIHSFIDEAFDAKKTASYKLLLQIGMNDIQVAVHDNQKNKYIALEQYKVVSTSNFETLDDLYDSLLKDSKLTGHKFQSVACIIVNNLSTLIPNVLFEEDRKKMYLDFNASLEGNEIIVVDEIKSLEAKNIFAFPLSLKTKMNASYTNIQYHHHSSILIDTLVANNKNQTGKKLYVHIQSTHFETLVIDGKKLVFYNTFNYHTPEDFIYYLMFACEQLQLNPEKIETLLLGELEKTAIVYTLANKYIRNIKFEERSGDSDYSYQLQTLPKHSYFTLFNSYSS